MVGAIYPRIAKSTMRVLILTAALALSMLPVLAKGSGSHTSSSEAHSTRASSGSKKSKCTTCARTSSDEIKRSRTATRDFQKSHPCPATGKTSGSCPDSVIDHVTPLKRGGADAPTNMKDKIE
jgi:hypothetical protein